jgi:hypothetical protein
MALPSNPRMQRTPSAPLMRKPLGGMGKLSLFAAVVLAGIGSAFAIQWSSTDAGTLSVRVRDAEDHLLPGAMVILSRFGGPEVARGATGSKGDILFPNLPPGSYEVRCELRGLEADYSAVVKVKPRWPCRVTLTMTTVVNGDDIMVGEPVRVTPTPGLR